MSPEEKMFAEATELPVEKRDSFLRDACAGNEELQERMAILLSAHDCKSVFVDIAETHSEQIQDIDEGLEIGRYRLLQKLGEGGFGVVYMAQQIKPIERKVAIKIIKPGMDSRAVIARFEAERQALAMMEHPNIARVLDGGASHDGQRPYFVMELVQGVPITEFCDTNSFSTRERLELFISVCSAVQHAHQKGIIHRDIKPSNVLVTLHDGKPVAKVIDFGVAKALHMRLTDKTMFTQFGAMVGTPQYMSPEQAEMTGLDVDTRSDIYSLAVLLYELMTGTTPLESDELRAVGLRKLQEMICQDEPPRPSARLSSAGARLTILAKHRSVAPERLAREVKGDLDWIIMKGLEKDRTRRYESAKELAADVRRALDHQPVLAGPPSIVYRSRKFLWRNRVQLILAVAASGVVAALLWSLVNHRRHQLATAQKDEVRLSEAIDETNTALMAAIENPDANELWKAASLASRRIKNLASTSLASESTLLRAESCLEKVSLEEQDRLFQFSVEELLIDHSTNRSGESLKTMEKGFRKILGDRGYDIESMSPTDLASRLTNDHAPVKLTDAIELWLATRLKLRDAGLQEISNNEIAEWKDAMNSADPHPLRNAIREMVFRTKDHDKSFLDKAVASGKLSEMCARKLSWLAQAYEQSNDLDRSNEIRNFALVLHSNDLLLNFEHGVRLMEQERFDEAVRYLMRCTSIRPLNSDVWKMLAVALDRNREPLEALRMIKIAVELNPKDAEGRLLQAEWMLENQQPKQAVASAETSLKLDGNRYHAYRIIGQANQQMQKYSQALVSFEAFQQRARDEEKHLVDKLIRECQQKIGSAE